MSSIPNFVYSRRRRRHRRQFEAVMRSRLNLHTTLWVAMRNSTETLRMAEQPKERTEWKHIKGDAQIDACTNTSNCVQQKTEWKEQNKTSDWNKSCTRLRILLVIFVHELFRRNCLNWNHFKLLVFRMNLIIIIMANKMQSFVLAHLRSIDIATFWMLAVFKMKIKTKFRVRKQIVLAKFWRRICATIVAIALEKRSTLSLSSKHYKRTNRMNVFVCVHKKPP